MLATQILEFATIVENSDDSNRVQTVAQLRGIVSSGRASIIGLNEIISNPNDLRLTTIWLIGKLQLADFANRLLEIMLESPSDEELVVYCATALSMLEPQSVPRIVINRLIYQVDKGSTTLIRWNCAYVLGFLGVQEATSILRSILTNRTNETILRTQCAEALAYLGDKESVPTLLQGLKEASPEMRFWCLFALGELADTSVLKEIEALFHDETVVNGFWAISQEAREVHARILERYANLSP